MDQGFYFGSGQKAPFTNLYVSRCRKTGATASTQVRAENDLPPCPHCGDEALWQEAAERAGRAAGARL